MHLTRFTDYVLRTLIYLGSHPGEVIPAVAISEAYGISSDHAAKAAKWLVQHGYVRGVRGQHGGLVLDADPATIRLGALIRETEPHMHLLECFDPEAEAGGCPIHRACLLKRALRDAQRAFFAVLDGYTLDDVLANAPALMQLLPPAERPR